MKQETAILRTVDNGFEPFQGPRFFGTERAHSRNGLEIAFEILRFCDAPGIGRLQTRIMYYSNLSYKQIKEHLNYLVVHGFLEQSGRYYSTTQYGRRFLEELTRVLQMWHKPILLSNISTKT